MDLGRSFVAEKTSRVYRRGRPRHKHQDAKEMRRAEEREKKLTLLGTYVRALYCTLIFLSLFSSLFVAFKKVGVVKRHATQVRVHSRVMQPCLL